MLPENADFRARVYQHSVTFRQWLCLELSYSINIMQ